MKAARVKLKQTYANEKKINYKLFKKVKITTN